MQGKVGFGTLLQQREQNLPPQPFLQRFRGVKRGEQEFFGWTISDKNCEVLGDAVLVVVVCLLTATRFIKKSFLWASGCL